MAYTMSYRCESTNRYCNSCGGRSRIIKRRWWRRNNDTSGGHIFLALRYIDRHKIIFRIALPASSSAAMSDRKLLFAPTYSTPTARCRMWPKGFVRDSHWCFWIKVFKRTCGSQPSLCCNFLKERERGKEWKRGKEGFQTGTSVVP